MSLINRMLQDLDKRQADGASVSMLADEVRPLPKRGELSPRFRHALLAIGLAGSLLLLWQSRPELFSRQSVPANAPAALAKADNAPDAARPAASADTPPPPAPATEAVPAAAAVPEPEASPGGISPQAARLPEVAATAPIKTVSAAQRADHLYAQALRLVEQGRISEAQPLLRQVLAAESAHADGRLLLAATLATGGRSNEAISLLRDGLAISPAHGGMALALARLLDAGGARGEALKTLEAAAGGAAADDPEFRVFLAALLQQQGRHAEAIPHFIAALASDPGRPAWLVGAGISLQAENHLADAAEAFQRVLEGGEAPPTLARLAEQRLRQLRPHGR